MAIKAVLTGDIVRSRTLTPDDFTQVLSTLDSACKVIQKQSDATYEIFRGDAFQILFPNPEDSISAAITIRLALRASLTSTPDARISIGLGEIDPPAATLGRSSGEAFILSGHHLDTMAAETLVVSSPSPAFQRDTSLLTRFADRLLSQTTNRQANALYHYLTDEDNSHQAIASLLRTSRVNVTKLLNQAEYQLISDYLDDIRQRIREGFS
ncbi:hypothetical protein NF212_08020 [Parasalinivibrio latis]|uniref:hypothetical protein n=1 Tax=Parasalinivibrio latis TaxID=2952610 RepID=UPI0030E2A5E8